MPEVVVEDPEIQDVVEKYNREHPGPVPIVAGINEQHSWPREVLQKRIEALPERFDGASEEDTFEDIPETTWEEACRIFPHELTFVHNCPHCGKPHEIIHRFGTEQYIYFNPYFPEEWPLSDNPMVNDERSFDYQISQIRELGYKVSIMHCCYKCATKEFSESFFAGYDLEHTTFVEIMSFTHLHEHRVCRCPVTNHDLKILLTFLKGNNATVDECDEVWPLGAYKAKLKAMLGLNEQKSASSRKKTSKTGAARKVVANGKAADQA